MKDFKGTEGNWERFDSAVVVNGVQIADVYCYGDLEDNRHEALANAQLIATAPELLEASIMVAEMLDFNKGVEIPDDAWNTNVSNLWSVINKALGNDVAKEEFKAGFTSKDVKELLESFESTPRNSLMYIKDIGREVPKAFGADVNIPKDY